MRAARPVALVAVLGFLDVAPVLALSPPQSFYETFRRVGNWTIDCRSYRRTESPHCVVYAKGPPPRRNVSLSGSLGFFDFLWTISLRRETGDSYSVSLTRDSLPLEGAAVIVNGADHMTINRCGRGGSIGFGHWPSISCTLPSEDARRLLVVMRDPQSVIMRIHDMVLDLRPFREAFELFREIALREETRPRP